MYTEWRFGTLSHNCCVGVLVHLKGENLRKKRSLEQCGIATGFISSREHNR